MSDHSDGIFSACPHDVIDDPEKWSALIDYLHSKKVFDGRFERHSSFSDFASNFPRFDLAYAHPLDLVEMIRKHGFIPIACYDDVYDEAVVIAYKNLANPSLLGATTGSIAFVNGSPSHAAFLIEMNDQNIPIQYNPTLKDNYNEVLMDVALGVVEYGIILKSVWDTMLVMRDRVVPFHTTATQKLVHAFVASAEMQAEAPTIQQAFLSMHEDAEGQAILGRLLCKKMVVFNQEDAKKLELDLSVCVFEE